MCLPSPSWSSAFSSLNKEFRRVRDVPGLSPDLVLCVPRHSFATTLLDAIGNIKLVPDTLGHADTKITSTYPHPATGGISDVINQRNDAAVKNLRHILRHTRILQVAVSGRLKVSK
jgi:integrase